MLTLHTTVLLYKDLSGKGFNILSPDFKHLEENLSYVEMENVTFEINEAALEIFKASGKKTVHAVAKGTLVNALPLSIKPSDRLINKARGLIQIDYNPHVSTKFFSLGLDTGPDEITFAKQLIGIDRRVYVAL